MLFQLLARVGRAPVDKKVFFGQSESFGVPFIFFLQVSGSYFLWADTCLCRRRWTVRTTTIVLTTLTTWIRTWVFPPEILWNIIFVYSYLHMYLYLSIKRTILFWKRRPIMKRLAAWSGILRAAFSFPRVNSKNHFLSSQKSLLRSQRSNHHFIVTAKGTDPSPGEKTLPLESRLRYNAYSPHHTIRQVNNSTIMMMMMMMKKVVCCN